MPELQAEAGPRSLALEIIRHHLDDLPGQVHKRYASTNASLQQVLESRGSIVASAQTGRRFRGHVTFTSAILPVRRIGDDFVVILNDNALPSIRWNPYYRKLLAAGDKDARSYLVKQMKRARFLLRSIEQRRITISRVMETIVARQRRFFLEGPGHLEP